jgi:hypothetical protein
VSQPSHIGFGARGHFLSRDAMGKVKKSQRACVAEFAGTDVHVTIPVIDTPVMTAASMDDDADPYPAGSEWLTGGIKQGFPVRSNSDGWFDNLTRFPSNP